VGLVSTMYCFMSGRMTGRAWFCYVLLYVKEDDWVGLVSTMYCFYVREDDWVGLVSDAYCYMLGRMTGWAWCLLCNVLC
jgi:hypothetical protein